ncbi:MAG: L-rhamnose mutarotase [Bacteroidota bacterium]
MTVNSPSSRRYCLACDLKDDAALIKQYQKYHAPGNAWPEITASIRNAGILDMQIYQTGNRLYMIMEVDETFSFERKQAMDAANPKVIEWETLMSDFQQPLPWASAGEKWILLEQIFQLD